MKSFNKDEILAKVFFFLFFFQLLTRVHTFNKSGGDNLLLLIRTKETWMRAGQSIIFHAPTTLLSIAHHFKCLTNNDYDTSLYFYDVTKKLLNLDV